VDRVLDGDLQPSFVPIADAPRGKVFVSDPSTNAELGPRFDEAFRFAAESTPRDSGKKTDVPYISHLMSVAALVMEAGGDEDQTIAALLHDVVEDCGGNQCWKKSASALVTASPASSKAAPTPITIPSHREAAQARLPGSPAPGR